MFQTAVMFVTGVAPLLFFMLDIVRAEDFCLVYLCRLLPFVFNDRIQITHHFH